MNKSPKFHNLDNLNNTTITTLCKLSFNMAFKDLFLLLPITNLNIPDNTITSKKLPLCKPGSILVLNFDKKTRGVVLQKKKKKNSNEIISFKNSLSIYMSLTDKNINLKLSNTEIHSCGSKNESHQKEVIERLINHIFYIQYLLNKIQHMKETTNKTLKWVREFVKGKKVFDEELQTNRYTVNSNSLKPIDIKNIKYSEIDEEIAKYFLQFRSNSLNYCDKFYIKLDYVVNMVDVVSNINYDYKIENVMHNYNFSFGKSFSLHLLYLELSKVEGFGKTFFITYNNDAMTYLILQVLYDKIERSFKMKEKVKNFVSFIFYSTGSLTLSGPNHQIIKEKYNFIIEHIKKVQDIVFFN